MDKQEQLRLIDNMLKNITFGPLALREIIELRLKLDKEGKYNGDI